MPSKGRRAKETRGQYIRCSAQPCKRKAEANGLCSIHAAVSSIDTRSMRMVGGVPAKPTEAPEIVSVASSDPQFEEQEYRRVHYLRDSGMSLTQAQWQARTERLGRAEARIRDLEEREDAWETWLNEVPEALAMELEQWDWWQGAPDVDRRECA